MIRLFLCCKLLPTFLGKSKWVVFFGGGGGGGGGLLGYYKLLVFNDHSHCYSDLIRFL